MKKTVCILASLLVGATLFLSLSCSKGARPPVEGEKAPDFSVNDLVGEPVRMSDLRGKVVLLHFWATWCRYCREEAPSLARLNTVMTGKDFRMITVSLDKGGGEDVESFFHTAGLRLPTVADPAGTVGKQYGVTGVPETFIIDGEGVVRKKIVGALQWDDPEMIRYIEGLMQR